MWDNTIVNFACTDLFLLCPVYWFTWTCVMMKYKEPPVPPAAAAAEARVIHLFIDVDISLICHSFHRKDNNLFLHVSLFFWSSADITLTLVILLHRPPLELSQRRRRRRRYGREGGSLKDPVDFLSSSLSHSPLSHAPGFLWDEISPFFPLSLALSLSHSLSHLWFPFRSSVVCVCHFISALPASSGCRHRHNACFYTHSKWRERDRSCTHWVTGRDQWRRWVQLPSCVLSNCVQAVCFTHSLASRISLNFRLMSPFTFLFLSLSLFSCDW